MGGLDSLGALGSLWRTVWEFAFEVVVLNGTSSRYFVTFCLFVGFCIGVPLRSVEGYSLPDFG